MKSNENRIKTNYPNNLGWRAIMAGIVGKLLKKIPEKLQYPPPIFSLKPKIYFLNEIILI